MKGSLTYYWCRDYNVVKSYLENKGDVNAPFKDQITSFTSTFTILTHAISFRNIDLIRLVINAKADVNQSSDLGTPLMVAVQEELPGLVDLLLQQKDIIPDKVGEFGATPLLYVIYKGRHRKHYMIDALLGAGASLKGTQPARIDLETWSIINKHTKCRIRHTYVCLIQRGVAKDCVKIICKMIWETRIF
jgi:ankyrin repeat protein